MSTTIEDRMVWRIRLTEEDTPEGKLLLATYKALVVLVNAQEERYRILNGPLDAPLDGPLVEELIQ